MNRLVSAYVRIPNLFLPVLVILIQLDDALIEILDLSEDLGSLLLFVGIDVLMLCDFGL